MSSVVDLWHQTNNNTIISFVLMVFKSSSCSRPHGLKALAGPTSWNGAFFSRSAQNWCIDVVTAGFNDMDTTKLCPVSVGYLRIGTKWPLLPICRKTTLIPTLFTKHFTWAIMRDFRNWTKIPLIDLPVLAAVLFFLKFPVEYVCVIDNTCRL